jgi:hypothetical protein
MRSGKDPAGRSLEREVLAQGGQGKKGKGGIKNPEPCKTKNSRDKRNVNSDEFSSDSN